MCDVVCFWFCVVCVDVFFAVVFVVVVLLQCVCCCCCFCVFDCLVVVVCFCCLNFLCCLWCLCLLLVLCRVCFVGLFVKQLVGVLVTTTEQHSTPQHQHVCCGLLLVLCCFDCFAACRCFLFVFWGLFGCRCLFVANRFFFAVYCLWCLCLLFVVGVVPCLILGLVW